MPEGGTSIFTDADDYQASLMGLLDLLVVQPSEFRSRLTWVTLSKIRLVRAREGAARVAYVSLPPALVFVTFATRRGSLLICDGDELPFGSLLFHGLGERFYQRTTAASAWGSISLRPASLKFYSRAISGRVLSPPDAGRILRPPHADWTQLLHLHAQVGRIAETQLAHIGHPEVARALEQDLIWALVNCLTTIPRNRTVLEHRQARVMARFQETLAAHPGRLLSIPEICRGIGVSEPALRACCAKVLGMSPGRYQRLRRLKLVRMELLSADPAMASVAEIVGRFGYTNFHCFVAEYRQVYGNTDFGVSQDPEAK